MLKPTKTLKKARKNIYVYIKPDLDLSDGAIGQLVLVKSFSRDMLFKRGLEQFCVHALKWYYIVALSIQTQNFKGLHIILLMMPNERLHQFLLTN